MINGLVNRCHPFCESINSAHTPFRVVVDFTCGAISHCSESIQLDLIITGKEELKRVIGIETGDVVTLHHELVSLNHSLPSLKELGLIFHLVPDVEPSHVHSQHCVVICQI